MSTKTRLNNIQYSNPCDLRRVLLDHALHPMHRPFRHNLWTMHLDIFLGRLLMMSKYTNCFTGSTLNYYLMQKNTCVYEGPPSLLGHLHTYRPTHPPTYLPTLRPFKVEDQGNRSLNLLAPTWRLQPLDHHSLRDIEEVCNFFIYRRSKLFFCTYLLYNIYYIRYMV